MSTDQKRQQGEPVLRFGGMDDSVTMTRDWAYGLLRSEGMVFDRQLTPGEENVVMRYLHEKYIGPWRPIAGWPRRFYRLLLVAALVDGLRRAATR